MNGYGESEAFINIVELIVPGGSPVINCLIGSNVNVAIVYVFITAEQFAYENIISVIFSYMAAVLEYFGSL